jgi:Leucine-rich repeat (LRR) protein
MHYLHLRISDIFSSAPNVEELILAKNYLKIMPQGIALLRRLKYLDLSENPLQYVYNFQDTLTRVICNLTELQWLSLSSTPLKSLQHLYGFLGPQTTGSYPACIHLLGLDVSFCDITSLNDVLSAEIFNEQTSLQSINLSGNNISIIPPQLFSALSDLRRLNISSLILSKGPKLELESSTLLECIDLSYNSLTSPGDVLTSGAVLSLNLSHNKIQQWHDADIFKCSGSRQTICFNSSEIPPDPSSVLNFKLTTVWVKHINLSYNALTEISTQTGTSLNRLERVDLGGNPFTCNNCTLIEFQKWLRNLDNNSITSAEYVILGVKRNLLCSEPYSYKGESVHDVEFRPEFCEPEHDKDWMIQLIALPTILIVMLIISVPVYIYRYEVTYLCHLVKVMRKRRATGRRTSEDFQYDAFVCYR